MTILGSKFAKSTFGWLIWKFRLRKIDDHARALFGVPENEWAPWTHDRHREEVERFVRGEYAKADTSNQRVFVAHFGCSAEDAAVMEKNLALGFDKALGEKLEDVRELLPRKRATPANAYIDETVVPFKKED